MNYACGRQVETRDDLEQPLVGSNPEAVLAFACRHGASVLDDEVDRSSGQMPVFLYRTETLASRIEHVEITVLRACPQSVLLVETEALYLVVADASVLCIETLHAPFSITFCHTIDTSVESCQQQAAVGTLSNPLNFEILHLVLRVHLHGIETEDGAIWTTHHGTSCATKP